MSESDQSNQANVQSVGESTQEYDPHLSTSMGKSIKMPSAGITHGPSVNYDTTTESDDNKGMGT